MENGVEEEIVTGGNDVTLTMKKSGVQVDIQINEDWIDKPEGHFTIQEWKNALEGRRRFFEMLKALDTVVEIEL